MDGFVTVRGRGRGCGRGSGARGASNSGGQSSGCQVARSGNQQPQQQRTAPLPTGGNADSDSDPKMPPAEKQKKLIAQELKPIGSAGQPISLIGNFYKMVHSDVTVFHYDVNFIKGKRDNADAKTKPSAPKYETEPQKPNPKMPKKSKKQQEEEEEATEEVVIDDDLDETKVDEEMATSFDRFVKRFSAQIINQVIDDHPNVFTSNVRRVYDGFKNLYTATKLNFPAPSKKKKNEIDIEELEEPENAHQEKQKKKKKMPDFVTKVAITIDSRVVEFIVEMKLVERVQLAEALSYYRGEQTTAISERVLSIFEVIFIGLFSQQFVCHQRKFFNLDQAEHSNKVRRCDFVHGFINSVKMTEFGLALNVHLKTTCVISKSFTMLDHLVSELAQIRNLEETRIQPKALREINRIIRHLKIFTSHTKQSDRNKGSNKMTYTVDSIIDLTPGEYHFPLRDGGRISIASYFLKEYNIKLKKYPLVKTTGKKARYLPLELCYLVDKQFLNNSKIDNEIQKELLLKSTHSPNMYFNKLSSIVSRVSGLDQALQKQFGLGIATMKPVSFEGRVLPPPKQISGQRLDPFYQAKEVNNWALITFDEPSTRLQFASDALMKQFIEEMQKVAKNFKMKFAEPKMRRIVPLNDLDSVEKELNKVMCSLKGLELIIIGIPSRHSQIKNTTDLYQSVKHYTDQVYGVISQCFKADLLKSIPRGYFENFLLKVNGKIGGKNNVIETAHYRSLMPALGQPTMIIGIDVNHPSETEKVFSSVSAAVGSYDVEFSKYAASIRVQKKERDELVKQLDEMILELLGEFARANKGRYPVNLIVFRDGVSEGQFEKVQKTEIPLIKAAINKTSKGMKLTVIVVQKRHHTRFVRAEPLVAQQRPGPPGRRPPRPIYNVPSGTVVDTAIVEPIYKSFYLNSHFSQLGTSKPTKYVILQDDLGFTTDNIQKFCFYACHTCIRTRLVSSIPTAVRYADLAAYRAKAHIEAQHSAIQAYNVVVDGDDSEAVEQKEAAIINQLNEMVKIKANIRNQLYYC